MTAERQFPIMIGWRGTPGPCPSSIPWALIAPYEDQAKYNHCGQSLERLAERGGLSPLEAFLAMNGKTLRSIDDKNFDELSKEACAFLDKLVRDREQLRTDHDRYKGALEAISTTDMDAPRIREYAAAQLRGLKT